MIRPAAILVTSSLLFFAAESRKPAAESRRLGQASGVASASAPMPSVAPVFTRAPLADAPRALLPLGTIRPRGWLKRQLEIQAAGLTGHLHDIWADVGPNSGWLGGNGESWERGPYYLDGLVPLAWLLDDARLKSTAQKFVDWTLEHQQADGWVGPRKNTDWWPNFVILKVLTQYHEATGDPRVVPVLQKYFAHHLAAGRGKPLNQWAVFRWADELVSVLWLYNRTGDPALLELARMLHEQGADWRKWFEDFPYKERVSEAQIGLKPGLGVFPDTAMFAHGVNNAMALKTSAVWSLVSKDDGDRNAIYRALDVLDRYHGLPNGMFSGTEHYAGTDATQGVELCAVVEALFSLQQVLTVNPDPVLADRLERIAMNALPATFTADMWGHQYDQQPNQVLCTLEKRAWVSNGPESNLFGMEPNFGCCTANMHQGWPKLVQSLWIASRDGGLAAVLYAPNEVRTVAGGVPVTIAEDTEYPFRDTVTFTITPARPAKFPLTFRVPQWAAGTTIALNDQPPITAPPGDATFEQITWKPGDRVVLKLPMRTRLATWDRDAITIERGPFVYALRIDEDWKEVAGGMKHPAVAPAKDWEVRPRSPWNYGLLVTPQTVGSLVVTEKPVGEFPFSPLGAPLEIAVPARRIPEWTLVDGSAGPLPQSPVVSKEKTETVTLVPYGSAKLRVTEFPVVAERR
jgi:hypothetical protein